MEDWLKFVTALVVLLGAIYASWRQQSKKVAEIHVLVNDRLDRALAEIRSLKQSLKVKDDELNAPH